MIWYIFSCSWFDTRWQQYSSHLHTSSTPNTKNGTYITITKLNTHNNKILTHLWSLYIIFTNIFVLTSLVVLWSGFLTTNHEVPCSIPGSTVGILLEGEDSRGDHCLGRLVDFRLKVPPGTTSTSITTHTPSGQRNCASWASQPRKTVTVLPCPGGRTTKSTKDTWWHWAGKILFSNIMRYCGNILSEPDRPHMRT